MLPLSCALRRGLRCIYIYICALLLLLYAEPYATLYGPHGLCVGFASDLLGSASTCRSLAAALPLLLLFAVLLLHSLPLLCALLLSEVLSAGGLCLYAGRPTPALEQLKVSPRPYQSNWSSSCALRRYTFQAHGFRRRNPIVFFGCGVASPFGLSNWQRLWPLQSLQPIIRGATTRCDIVTSDAAI